MREARTYLYRKGRRNVWDAEFWLPDGRRKVWRKEDVDLSKRALTVRRSDARETTKGGHADTINFPDALAPYLESAIAGSRSHLVFPAPNGRMWGRNSPVAKRLRSAMAKAGIVLGSDHKCRTCKARGAEHVELHPDNTIRRCPVNGHKLWPAPVVRKIRFHDLRHMTGTQLAMNGADPVAIQKIMRHRDPRLTMDTYAPNVPVSA